MERRKEELDRTSLGLQGSSERVLPAWWEDRSTKLPVRGNTLLVRNRQALVFLPSHWWELPRKDVTSSQPLL